MKRILILISVCGGLAAATLPADSAPGRYVDLTESGSLLRFVEAPSETRVELTGDPTVDRPAFEVRARRGERLRFRFPGLGESWGARAWDGPGSWRELRTAAHPGGLVVEFLALRDREVVELVPTDRALMTASGYTYTEYTNYIAALPTDSRLVLTELGQSVQGRPIHKIVFDDPVGSLPASRKRTMVILVRQHGDEWACSFVFEGMLDFLLGRRATQPQREITRGTRWIFYPLINPDGVVLDQRWNANGVDLNRDWGATGPTVDQEPEVFLVQSDLGALPTGRPRSAGDHHGWSSGVDGGFRSSDGGLPVGVTHEAYLESVADTNFYTAYEPAVFDWIENGGQDGMARVELYHWLDWVVHTPEYDGGLRDEEALRLTGERYIQAMFDALHGVTFLDSMGGLVRQFAVGDDLFVEVDDLDENEDPRAVETVRVSVRDRQTGDRENLLLTETGVDTGIFVLAAPIPTSSDPVVAQDGTLQTQSGARITAQYTDDDRPLDNSLALVRAQ